MSSAILHRIQSRLEADERVTAMWLAGSHGRGTADALSDIDLWLAVKDEAIGEMIRDPLAFVHAIVPTIMHIRAPSIAPVDGVYLLTWVPTGDGFEQVDWYCMPVSSAHRPAQTRLLLERHPVPVDPALESERLATSAWIAAIDGTIKNALLMLANTWKQAQRRDAWQTVSHFQHVGACLSQLDYLIQERQVPSFDTPTVTFLPETIPHGLEDQREALQGLLSTLGAMVVQAGRTNESNRSISAFAFVLSS